MSNFFENFLQDADKLEPTSTSLHDEVSSLKDLVDFIHSMSVAKCTLVQNLTEIQKRGLITDRRQEGYLIALNNLDENIVGNLSILVTDLHRLVRLSEQAAKESCNG
jgi:hypothetical protein